MDIQNLFDSNQLVREKIINGLEQKIGIDFEENQILTWQELVEALESSRDVNIEHVAGVKAGDNTFYPFAEYGWDGGYPISTYSFNLNFLSSVSIAGGPCASLVQTADNSMSGIAFHKGVDFFAIHIYD